MRFYRSREMDPGTQPSVLWDPNTGRALFEFVKGVCDVPDSNVELIEKMKRMGYLYHSPQLGHITSAAEEARLTYLKENPVAATQTEDEYQRDPACVPDPPADRPSPGDVDPIGAEQPVRKPKPITKKPKPKRTR